MTVYFKAKGVTSAGGAGKDQAISLGSTITEGLKSAIGRRVELSLTDENLAFVLSVLAQRFPDAFRNIAEELEDYEPPKHGHDHSGIQSRLGSLTPVKGDDHASLADPS